MADMQDAINRILSNPEAMKQVQSLGEKLGLGAQKAPPPAPAAEPEPDMSRMMTALAPLMSSYSAEDETSALLKALRPFLSEEKSKRLDQAQRMIKLLRLIPLLKESGLFF